MRARGPRGVTLTGDDRCCRPTSGRHRRSRGDRRHRRSRRPKSGGQHGTRAIGSRRQAAPSRFRVKRPARWMAVPRTDRRSPGSHPPPTEWVESRESANNPEAGPRTSLGFEESHAIEAAASKWKGGLRRRPGGRGLVRSRTEWLAPSARGRALAERAARDHAHRCAAAEPRGSRSSLSGAGGARITRVIARGPECRRTLASHGAGHLHGSRPHRPAPAAHVRTWDWASGPVLDCAGPPTTIGSAQSSRAPTFSHVLPSGRAREAGSSGTVVRLRPGISLPPLDYGTRGRGASGGVRDADQSVSGSPTSRASARPRSPAPPAREVVDHARIPAAFGAPVAAGARRRAREGGSYLVRGSLASGALGRWARAAAVEPTGFRRPAT